MLKAESVTTPQAKFTNSDFNARLLGLDPKSPYVTQRPNQNYFWYSTGEAQVERRDPGIQLATVDESLSPARALRTQPCQRAAAAPSSTAWTRPQILVQDPKALNRLHLPAPATKQEPPTKGTAPGLDISQYHR